MGAERLLFPIESPLLHFEVTRAEWANVVTANLMLIEHRLAKRTLSKTELAECLTTVTKFVAELERERR